MLLRSKSVVVTGGARGIGAEIVLGCLREGATVRYIDFDESPLHDRMRRAAAVGAEVTFHAGDITDEPTVVELAKDLCARGGGVDVLVNNAGITRDGLAMRMGLEQWETVLKVNLTGAFLMSREISRHLLKKRAGSIINISSVVGLVGNAGQTNYSASKAGLIGLTMRLAREVAPRGVRVNAIAPGYIETEMTARMSDAQKEAFLSQIPLRRGGEPADVAKAVLFLASNLSSYLTGQTIRVDGGMVM